MRAIIIEEDRFAEVADLMEKRALEMKMGRYPSLMDPKIQQMMLGIGPKTFEIIVQDIHRAMHYEFVRWAQSHGASCVHR